MADITSNLVGWWKFDGDCTDSSGNANDLTPAGSTSFPSGVVGNAIDLAGSNYATATLTSSVTGDAAHTISAWVQLSNPSPSTRQWLLILGQTDVGAHHWIYSSGSGMQFGRWNEDAGEALTVQPTFTANVWRHIALVYSSGTLSLYENGTFTSSKNDGKTFNFTSAGLAVGKSFGGEDNAVALLDDLRIYSRALSADDVGYLYHYPFDPAGDPLFL